MGCPVSRRAAKRDIHAVTAPELNSYYETVLAAPAPRAVDALDLYDRISLVVAAIQMQSKEIQALDARARNLVPAPPPAAGMTPVRPAGVHDAELRELYDQLRAIQLSTYAYKAAPPEAPRRLGFIIDDTNAPAAINPDGNSVDLYGYLGMAMAAVQVQAREIEGLRARIHEIERGPLARSARHER